MELTVGILEGKVREFSKGTPIHLACDNCNHSISGSENILKIDDRTNQTFGYIELHLNHRVEGRIECAKDEKEFYEAEITKLKEELKKANSKINMYKDELESVKSCYDRIKRRESYIDRD